MNIKIDALCEYIKMLLMHDKRPEELVTDLEWFLHENTVEFVEWYFKIRN